MKNISTLRKFGIFLIFLIFLFCLGLYYVENYYINVVERTDFSRAYDCQKTDCLKPYYEFPSRFRRYKKEITKQDLQKQIIEAKAARASANNRAADFDDAELKRIILGCLNIEFLLKGINARRLVVTTIKEIDRGDYTEKELLFEDKYVGIFHVLMLIPKQENELLPATIGLHGHMESSIDFKLREGHLDIVHAGLIMIMPSFRAMNADMEENDISEKLILNGFTLMGIRVYETLLLVKYLEYLDNVDKTRIGIIGHSGGGAVARLVAQISEVIKIKERDIKKSQVQ